MKRPRSTVWYSSRLNYLSYTPASELLKMVQAHQLPQDLSELILVTSSNNDIVDLRDRRISKTAGKRRKETQQELVQLSKDTVTHLENHSTKLSRQK